MAIAEAYAEAGSTPDRIVKTYSLALRRFRIDFVEVMLGAGLEGANEGHEDVKKPNGAGEGQGKLAKAVDELLETGGEANDQDWHTQLLDVLLSIGVRPSEPLILKLQGHMVGAANQQ